MNSPKFVKIANLENSIEVQLLESILKEQNIPYSIRSFYDTAYDGLFQFQKGWGEISAPLSHRSEIMDILSSIRSRIENDWESYDNDIDGEGCI